MKYVDYDWNLYPDRIILDGELNTDKLGWKGGDYFRFVNINGQQMLVKVDELERFILQGAQANEQISNVVEFVAGTNQDMVEKSTDLQRKRSL